MIKINNASLYLKDIKIINNLNLDISSKSKVGLIAKSGFGKTSFFRFLNGDNTLKLHGDLSFDKSTTGYVPQKGGLLDWLTFKEHLELFDIKIDKPSLKTLGIYELLDKKVRKLSGGEYHRVLIYIQVYISKKTLILDEPFVSLDIKNKEIVKNWVLNEVNRKGITLIMASHDVNLTFSMCENVVILNSKDNTYLQTNSFSSEEEFKNEVLNKL